MLHRRNNSCRGGSTASCSAISVAGDGVEPIGVGRPPNRFGIDRERLDEPIEETLDLFFVEPLIGGEHFGGQLGQPETSPRSESSARQSSIVRSTRAGPGRPARARGRGFSERRMRERSIGT